MEPESPVTSSTPPEQSTPVKKPSFWASVSRKRLIVVTISALVVLGAALGVGLAYKNQTSKPTSCVNDSCNSTQTVVQNLASPTPSATPVPVARLLDGVMVTAEEAHVRPLGVMIENHPDARPQSGLSSANWVYEAIAEGGITRFLALFANPDSTDVRVGPIRSVRTYFLDYAREYDAFLSHVGGNIDALDSITADGGITNLDQFSIGEPTYKRDFSRNVATEHTMYSTTANLWSYVKSKSYDTTASFTSLPFTDDVPVAERPAAQKVSINFSTPTFAVVWNYDPATNSYVRTMAGQLHKDAETGDTIKAKNIVIQTVDRKPTVTRINEQGWIYTLTGSGKVTVVQDGKAVAGTWKREGNGRTHYYDANGQEISLVRGTTWVEVVHTDMSNPFTIN